MSKSTSKQLCTSWLENGECEHLKAAGKCKQAHGLVALGMDMQKAAGNRKYTVLCGRWLAGYGDYCNANAENEGKPCDFAHSFSMLKFLEDKRAALPNTQPRDFTLCTEWVFTGQCTGECPYAHGTSRLKGMESSLPVGRICQEWMFSGTCSKPQCKLEHRIFIQKAKQPRTNSNPNPNASSSSATSSPAASSTTSSPAPNPSSENHTLPQQAVTIPLLSVTNSSAQSPAAAPAKPNNILASPPNSSPAPTGKQPMSWASIAQKPAAPPKEKEKELAKKQVGPPSAQKGGPNTPQNQKQPQKGGPQQQPPGTKAGNHPHKSAASGSAVGEKSNTPLVSTVVRFYSLRYLFGFLLNPHKVAHVDVLNALLSLNGEVTLDDILNAPPPAKTLSFRILNQGYATLLGDQLDKLAHLETLSFKAPGKIQVFNTRVQPYDKRLILNALKETELPQYLREKGWNDFFMHPENPKDLNYVTLVSLLPYIKRDDLVHVLMAQGEHASSGGSVEYGYDQDLFTAAKRRLNEETYGILRPQVDKLQRSQTKWGFVPRESSHEHLAIFFVDASLVFGDLDVNDVNFADKADRSLFSEDNKEIYNEGKIFAYFHPFQWTCVFTQDGAPNPALEKKRAENFESLRDIIQSL